MVYCISVDWLALYCYYPTASGDWQPVTGKADTIDAAYPWRYRVADYGTRQYKMLTFVDMPNEQGGYDEFAEVQSHPCSGVINARSVIVRFNNRVLYRPDMWDLVDVFLRDNNFAFHSISRIDICADFNQFKSMSPLKLIQGFANKELRHVGRGVGSLYFNHGIFTDRQRGTKDYGVNYTGLAFGTHSSDVRIYLYNKSFELLTQGDKPWIRDRWRAIGLDETKVWRLEVSIKSKGCHFKDSLTGEVVDVDVNRVRDTRGDLSKIYHTFVKKMFAFVKNHPHITNISREPRIELFNLCPIWVRHSLRNISKSSRTEKMIIKALYTLGDTYRGEENAAMKDTAQSFAVGIAESTDLTQWMRQKVSEWDVVVHK